MPTEKPRVTITMSAEELAQIQDFLYENRIKNQTQAILMLIRMGLEAIKDQPEIDPRLKEIQKHFEEMDEITADLFYKLLSDFETLNFNGKQQLAEYAELISGSEKYSKHSNIPKLKKQA